MHSTQHEEDQLMQYLRPNLKIQDTEPEWQAKLVDELTAPEDTIEHLKERLRSKSISPVNRKVEFDEKPAKIIRSMEKNYKNEGVQINLSNSSTPPVPPVPSSTPVNEKKEVHNHHHHHHHHHKQQQQQQPVIISKNDDNNKPTEFKGVNFHTGHSLYNDTFVRPPAEAYNQINKAQVYTVYIYILFLYCQRAWDDHIPFEYGNGYKDITTEYIDNISRTGLALYTNKRNKYEIQQDIVNEEDKPQETSIETQQSISFEENNNDDDGCYSSECSSCNSSRSSTPIKEIKPQSQPQQTVITIHSKEDNSTISNNKSKKLRSKTPTPTPKPSSIIKNNKLSKTPTYKSEEIQTSGSDKENNNCVCNRIIRPRSKSITIAKKTKTEGTQTRLIHDEEWKLNDKLNIKRRILRKRQENEGVIKRVGGGYSGVKPKAMTKSKSFNSSFFPSKLPNYSAWQRYNTFEKHECSCKKPDIPHCNEAKKPTEYNRNLKTTVDKLLKMKVDKYSKRPSSDYKSEYTSSYSDPVERERKSKLQAKLKVNKSF